MKTIDRLLQKIRIRQAAAYIPLGAELLDIGCADGVIFKYLGEKLSRGVGIDPDLEKLVEWDNFKLLPGQFPAEFSGNSLGKFDAITVLAVLEHIPPDIQLDFAQACADRLKPGGQVIITVPSHYVDAILAILEKLKIIDGMSLEQHYGFEHCQVLELFQQVEGLSMVIHKKFELGMNNLFVFKKG